MVKKDYRKCDENCEEIYYSPVFGPLCQYKLSLTDRLEEKCIHNLPPVEKSFEEFIENSGNRIYFVK